MLKLKKYFKTLPSRICLTTDTWTSIQNLSYMCLTAHYIDADWKLHKKIIIFCPISSHSGEVIGKAIERCLLDWEIDRIFTITVDNASSNNVGMMYLKRKLNSWKRSLQGDYLHRRCVAHILNSVVKDGLKEYSDSIKKIPSAVRYVRSSPYRLQRFKTCAKTKKIDTKSIVCLDIETRWNSTYLMLELALKFQKAFDLIETKDSKYVADLIGKDGLPTDRNWEYANTLLPFLRIFYDSTNKLL